MPKVSILVPIYNVEKYLRECLDSLVNQTLKDIEIICVNDGSTDNSRKILQEYADKDSRVKIIDKENGGISSVRNLGIKLAAGEYISFIDSDDWVSLDFLEKLYNAAVKYNADIACTNLVRVYKHKNTYYAKYKKYRCTNKPRLKYEWAKIPDNCYVHNRIYERKKLQKTGILFEEGINFEDMEFSHKILYVLNNFVTVPDTYYFYRDNPYSIVNINSEKNMNNYKYAIKKCLDFVAENNICWSRQRKYHYSSKESFHLFGLPLLKIVTYCNYKKYYILNVNVLTKKVNIWDKNMRYER